MPKIDNNLNYRSITYVCSLLLIIGVFLHFDNDYKQAIFDFIYDLIAITTFTFAFLWLKRQIILIGLIFYGISWNIDLITNPLTAIDTQLFVDINIGVINLILMAIGLICLLIGFIENLKQSFLTKELNIDIKRTIGILLVITILIQISLRIII